MPSNVMDNVTEELFHLFRELLVEWVNRGNLALQVMRYDFIIISAWMWMWTLYIKQACSGYFQLV